MFQASCYLNIYKYKPLIQVAGYLRLRPFDVVSAISRKPFWILLFNF
jgi:hypothetical protein